MLTFASFAPLPPAAIYRPPSAAVLNCAAYNKVGWDPCRHSIATTEVGENEGGRVVVNCQLLSRGHGSQSIMFYIEVLS